MLCYNWNIAGYINLVSLASSLHNELHLLHLLGIKFLRPLNPQADSRFNN
jgi:hypothetical protein